MSAAHEAVVFEQMADTSMANATAGQSEDAAFDQLVDNVAQGRAKNVAEGSKVLSRELQAQEYDKRRQAAMTTERLPYAADVYVADLAGGEPKAVTSGQQSAYPSWTSDGTRILFATNGSAGYEFCTIQPDGSNRQTILSGVKGVDPFTITLSRDGRYVFFASAVLGNEGMARAMTGETPADLHVAPVGSTKAKRLENKHPFKQRYSVSPDGKRIVYEVGQDLKLIGGAQKSELWLMRW